MVFVHTSRACLMHNRVNTDPEVGKASSPNVKTWQQNVLYPSSSGTKFTARFSAFFTCSLGTPIQFQEAVLAKWPCYPNSINTAGTEITLLAWFAIIKHQFPTRQNNVTIQSIMKFWKHLSNPLFRPKIKNGLGRSCLDYRLYPGSFPDTRSNPQLVVKLLLMQRCHHIQMEGPELSFQIIHTTIVFPNVTFIMWPLQQQSLPT